MSSFGYSRKAVVELASRYRGLIEEIEQQKTNDVSAAAAESKAEAEEALFTELCECCLWGNATDLSLLTSLTYSDVQALQGSEARKSAEKNVLVNDIGAAFRALKATRDKDGPTEKKRRVDIALDNAGFELYVDLVFAGYLLAAGLATEVVVHPKEIPWFVSDVTPTDFETLLEALAEPGKAFSNGSDNRESSAERTSSSGNEVLLFLSRHLNALRDEGKIRMQKDSFWHQAGSHLRMPKASPQLFRDFQNSELVIFKGDLHYRKLTSDVGHQNVFFHLCCFHPLLCLCFSLTLLTYIVTAVQAMWPATTPFAEVLGPLGVGSGIRTLALRTCKADVVVGLKEGVDERLRGEEEGGNDGDNGGDGGGGKSSGARKWAWTGKWALAQFCDGKL